MNASAGQRETSRNVEKPVFVCVVPHADPKLCPIVHITAALGNREIDPAYELFAEGFTHKPGQQFSMSTSRYEAGAHSLRTKPGTPWKPVP
jgi:hypothetical protein